MNIGNVAATVSAALKEQARAQADQTQQKELVSISTLLQQGRFAEATTALDEYRKKYPDAPLPPDTEPAGYYRSIYTGLDRAWITIQSTKRLLLVLVDLFATVVLGLLLILLVWVTAGRLWGFVRARLAPSLQVEAFTGSSAGVDIAALVRVALHHYSSPGLGNQRARALHLVTGPVDAISLPEVKGAPESTQLVTSILNWLLPPNIIKLTGKTQPAGKRGIGLTLELTDTRSKRQLACYTLWQDEFDPVIPAKPDATDPKPYLTLSEPAAVWAMFTYFQDRWAHGTWWQSHKRLRLSGTTDWQSYALLQAGTNWVRDSDREKGQQIYRRALTKDPRNYGARINLASLEMKKDMAHTALKTKQYVFAVTQLDTARNLMQKYGAGDQRDPAWYMASYLLAIAESGLERLDHPHGTAEPGQHGRQALEIARETLAQTTADLKVITDDLAKLPPPSAGGVCGAVYHLSRFPVRSYAYLFRKRVRTWWSECQKRARGEPLEIRDETSVEFLRAMRFAVGFSYARAQTEFKHFTGDITIIQEAKESGGEGLTAREHYNLACYYAQRAAQWGAKAKAAEDAHREAHGETRRAAEAESFKKALEALEFGLGLPSGAQGDWPLLDEALKPLRAHEPSKERFAELLKMYNGIPAKEPNALADMRGIGSYYAGKLKGEGYGTPDLLSPLAHNAEQRTTLAEHLNVSPVLVLRWVRLAQLHQAADKSSGAVNLLELAGVETLIELARANAGTLAERLTALNQDPKLLETPLTSDLIQKWIDAAAKAAVR